MQGKQILTLVELQDAFLKRKAVCVPSSYCYRKHKPAAWMIHQSGYILLRLFKAGMYIYKKGAKNGQ